MLLIRKNGATSNTFRVKLRSSTTGQGLTGLAISSSGLIISTIADNEASATNYTAAGSTIETITTLGTFATPTATKCRFKEVDATNQPGVYEFQIADARFAVSSAKMLKVSVCGVSGMIEREINIQLTSADVDDGVHLGISALPNTACTTNASLLTSGTGTDQLSVATGRIDIGKALGTAVTLDVNNVLNVSAKYVGGTSQTARDLGASVLLSSGTGTGQISLSSGTVTVGTNNDKTGYTASAVSDKTGYSLSVTPPTAAAIATAVWTDTTASDFTTALSVGKSLMNGVSLGTALTVGAVSGAVNSVTSGVTVTTNNDKAGYSLSVTPPTSAAIVTAMYTALLSSSDFSTAASIGALLNANIDAAISSRTKPADTQAAVALVTTTTNLTNAPTSGDLTATMKNSVTTAATAATPTVTAGTVADKTGYSLAANQHVIVDSGTVTTVTNQLTTAQIAAGVWQDATSGDFTVAGSIGKSLFTSGAVPGAASGIAIVGSNMGSVTSVSGSVGSVISGVTVATNNDKSGYGLAASQHVIVDSGTVTTLTNLPAITTDWITATGVSAAAVTKIQNGLASVGSKMDLIDTLNATAITAIQSGLSTYAGGPVASVSGSVGSVVGLDVSRIDVATSTRLATSSYASPPSAASIAAVLFVDGSTNRLKVNSDHSVNATVDSGGSVIVQNFVTVPPAVAAASQSVNVITCLRGDTLRVELPPMGNLSTRTKLVITAKACVDDSDDRAVFQVVEEVGLTRLNGSDEINPATASLSVSDATTGTVTLTINASITAMLTVEDLVWDAQAFLATGISSPISGIVCVVADVTQAVN